TAISQDRHQGVIEKQIQGENIIVISGQPYLIDHKTIIHGMVKRGETGPLLSIGSSLSFKLEKGNIGSIQRISEGWL
ncbi:MAG: hypothetical protein JKX87_02465, partial [Cycloclasticus sp.]|nr:hypothetical protein [Cycloclasticus sp.]